MVVERPRVPPPAPDHQIDAGVIEDARARQRRQRRVGATLLTAIAAAALLVGLTGGGGGLGGPGGQAQANPPSGSNPGPGAAHAGAGTSFPGAPSTQSGWYGVESRMCRLAKSNRYVPLRVGCVTSMRVDMNGDGRPDLVLVYSALGHRHLGAFAPGTAPPDIGHEYVPKAAFLKVVLAASGTTSTARIPGAWASAVDAAAQVKDDPGSELFLETSRTSSGATLIPFGWSDGRAVSAGAGLSVGGDSASRSGFACLAGKPPQVVQLAFELIGPSVNGWWWETKTVYAWHGPRLVQISRRTFRRHGAVTASVTRIGQGCLHGVA